MNTSISENNLRIDYVEFPATDIAAIKKFYSSVFGWKFEDYGPEYTAFHDGRLAGGFYQAETIAGSGALVVIYATDLEAAERQIKSAGGRILKDTFSFPGGRRFHFSDPSGNQLAVWSDHEPVG
jgi:predicted enzyme related to lactoylglutathione lyase